MTVEQFFATYYTQTTLSGIVAIAVFLKFKSRSKQVKLIGFSFLVSFICNALAFALWNSHYVKYTNVPQNLFFVINFCILTALYYSVLTPGYRVWLFISLSICIPFSIYDLFILQKDFIHSYAPFATSFFLITFTLIYFYRLMVELPAIHLQRLPMFWFNSALLFFHSGTLFLFAFTSYLIEVLKLELVAYWTFHNSLSILEHFIILIGLYFDLKPSQTKTSVASDS
jgi:hypothetical protein